MILFEIFSREDHPTYEGLAVANLNRQYDFLRSVILAAIDVHRRCLSQTVIKALNFHAIACLHTNAGEYRPTSVHVGNYEPPDHYRVPALMDDFVNQINRRWDSTDAVVLATYILWRLNWIHPFINGNGRTARVTCYYVICLKAGGWLAGETILPELIRQRRDDYVLALRAADQSYQTTGEPDLTALHALLVELLRDQFASAPNPNPIVPI